MPGWIASATGSGARGRRKPSPLGSVEALSQNWGGLTGQSGAGVHVRDLHDPQMAPIRFHPDLHAGSGWDRHITCALEHREVRLNQLTLAVPIMASTSPVLKLRSGCLLAQVQVGGIELAVLFEP